MKLLFLYSVVCVGMLGLTQPARSAKDEEPAAQTAPAESQPAGPPPKYRCDRPVYDLPHTWAGDKVEHVFTIHNDGKGPLNIIKIESACGCFVANDYTKTIAPGDSGRIPVSLVTAPQSEDVNKQMTIFTNDPEHPENVLIVQGKLVPRIKLNPIFGASWGRLIPGSPKFKVVQLINNMKEPMKLEFGPSEKGPFSATIKEIEPGKVAELIVTYQGPLKEGHHQGHIHLRTGLPEEPEIAIPCTLLVPPILDVVPIAFSQLKTASEPDRQTLLIRYNGEGPMKILSAEPSDPGVQAVLITKEAGRLYHLIVTMPAGYKLADPDSLHIKVKTDVDVKEVATFTIPIRARALSSSTTTAPN